MGEPRFAIDGMKMNVENAKWNQHDDYEDSPIAWDRAWEASDDLRKMRERRSLPKDKYTITENKALDKRKRQFKYYMDIAVQSMKIGQRSLSIKLPRERLDSISLNSSQKPLQLLELSKYRSMNTSLYVNHVKKSICAKKNSKKQFINPDYLYDTVSKSIDLIEKGMLDLRKMAKMKKEDKEVDIEHIKKEIYHSNKKKHFSLKANRMNAELRRIFGEGVELEDLETIQKEMKETKFKLNLKKQHLRTRTHIPNLPSKLSTPVHKKAETLKRVFKLSELPSVSEFFFLDMVSKKYKFLEDNSKGKKKPLTEHFRVMRQSFQSLQPNRKALKLSPKQVTIDTQIGSSLDEVDVLERRINKSLIQLKKEDIEIKELCNKLNSRYRLKKLTSHYKL